MLKIVFILFFPFILHALSLRNEKGELRERAKKLLHLCEVPQDLPENEILPYLQKHWLQAQKERWEMEEKFEEKKNAAFPILRDLGCIDSLCAQEKEFDYALILGALGQTMQKRLDFLVEEWKKGVRFKQIILLTGQRELNPDRENFPVGISTETELLLHLFKNSPLYGKVPHVVIDAPQEKLKNGTYRRPNTAGTIRDWLATSPNPGKCLAISSQPFVGYQEAVLRFFLPVAFKVEAVGPGIENMDVTADALSNQKIPFPMAIYLDNFAKWLLYEEMRELK